ncbi:tetratricopeptide repeat protein 39B-like [Uloborus diversus]|uniref:tetratricopeptide repeat protein 39B-like n=1 Tax=Uloborus diversus TaxID=327109 RepID=UPI00240A9451|nr:tetratricopeptide repeat protein 39B-like [Uloborus diversus]
MDIKEEDLGDSQLYEDVWEADPGEIESPEEKPNVRESIQETLHTLDLFMNNKFQEALDNTEPWAHCSSYHALGKGTVCFIQSILSFDPDDISKTMEVLKESVSVCNRLRKRGTLLYITRLLRGVDYNLYTSEEVHAELCYAECLLLTALMTFVADNSFVNFIKGGLRIRACYRAYKEALLILENRRWEDEEDRRHFESGVRMGLGIFYLVVSHLPTRIIRVLEMIGFCGDKEMGLQNMYDSVALEGSLRAPLTALFLLCYNTIITYLFGLADGDLVSSEYIIKNMLQRYPRGALYLFLHGRLLEVKGEFDQAINLLLDSLTVQDTWRQMRNLGSWELMWCYSFKFEWKNAQKYLEFLRKESRWSPAIYTYAYALTLYMQYLEDGRTDETKLFEVHDLMKKVPGLKQKLAGKSFPLEKFVVAKAKKFVNQNDRLLLPFFEKMYVFNVFPMFRNRPDTVEKILSHVQNAGVSLPEDREPSSEEAEDYCLSLLLKAACLKLQGNPGKARENLVELLKYENYLADDVYLATYAMAEIGYMAMDIGNYEEAIQWLDRSCHSHTDYHLESFLHYRIHAAIRHIQSLSSLLDHTTVSDNRPEENRLYSCSLSPPSQKNPIAIYDSPVPAPVSF